LSSLLRRESEITDWVRKFLISAHAEGIGVNFTTQQWFSLFKRHLRDKAETQAIEIYEQFRLAGKPYTFRDIVAEMKVKFDSGRDVSIMETWTNLKQNGDVNGYFLAYEQAKPDMETMGTTLPPKVCLHTFVKGLRPDLQAHSW
jgi:hypothetical protein